MATCQRSTRALPEAHGKRHTRTRRTGRGRSLGHSSRRMRAARSATVTHLPCRRTVSRSRIPPDARTVGPQVHDSTDQQQHRTRTRDGLHEEDHQDPRERQARQKHTTLPEREHTQAASTLCQELIERHDSRPRGGVSVGGIGIARSVSLHSTKSSGSCWILPSTSSIRRRIDAIFAR